MTTERLPTEPRQLWEQQQQSRDRKAESFQDLTEFISFRFRALKAAGVDRLRPQRPTLPTAPIRKVHAVNRTQTQICVMCRDTHSLHKCHEFGALTHQDKFDLIKANGLCLNCLGKGHMVSSCPSKSRCFKCQRAHHTQLLRETDEQKYEKGVNKTGVNIAQSTNKKEVLLATAMIKIESNTGPVHLRALLDQGSQTSLISESAVQQLGLKRKNTFISITGIGKSPQNLVKGITNVSIRTHGNDLVEFEALILDKLTNMIPSRRISPSVLLHLKREELADPYFDRPGHIDVLLGADVYARIILSNIYRMPAGPIAQQTKLGWIISGEVNNLDNNYQAFKVEVNHDFILSEQIRKFWEIEDISLAKSMSEEDRRCEEHFTANFRRKPDGRFIVKLPFKDEHAKQTLGSSRSSALGSLLALEKRLNSNSELKQQYADCINEYIIMEQMKPAQNRTDQETTDGKTISTASYLPHHAVYRESSTTNCRVVFDASRKTKSGISLIDVLLTGPAIQNDMLTVITRWRLYKFAFVADIAKMYRQIERDEADSNYQRILWRPNLSEEIKDYCLTTVTFGTTCAPFLPMRCLKQLADAIQLSNPKIADAIINEFYVDDLLSGDHQITDAITKRNDVTNVLNSGGFPLRKWVSNDLKLLEDLPKEDIEMDAPHNLDIDKGYKSLGIIWYPLSDQFGYKSQLPIIDESREITKRQILSEVAKLYDPLGWLAPVIISAKILLQSLWLHGLQWDELLDDKLRNTWMKFQENLRQLEFLRIPRWVKFTPFAKFELHGFCDASSKAYAANVYIVIRSDGTVDSHLLMAKTKVAPIRTVSIPRLELCGAVLLAKLIRKIKDMLNWEKVITFLWTDSEIVLAWLRDHPTRWTTFVANRTTEILATVGNSSWKHVPSAQNPADLASRGVTVYQLIGNDLWWNGPTWLKLNPDFWPTKKIIPANIEIRKKLVHASFKGNWDELHNKFSSIARLIRITVYCIRFINLIRKRSSFRKEPEVNEIRNACVFLVKYIELNQNYRNHEMDIDSNERLVHANIKTTNSLEELQSKFSSLTRLVRVTAYCFRFGELTRKLTKACKHLTAQEHQRAFEFWIRYIQRKQFSTELRSLESKKPLEKSSKLNNLNPFIDGNGFLRVGGRLANSSLPYDEKHPIIIPKNEAFVNLLLQQLHKETLHGQTQVMLNSLRRRFWLLDGRNAIKKIVHNCVKCFRAAAKGATQLMGSLPSPRTTICRPFTHTGVDYCGPFEVKDRKGRGCKITKGYVAIFICLSVKAIHIEVVSDLTTNAFLAALNRFMARRGLSSHMYCDCGTNFVGARSELDRVMRIASEKAAEELAARGISWHFNPPANPHFGGLWEAGVKAIKTHFRRVIGNAALTYEELSTVMVRIEACLNSRPLCPLNDDPNDVRALTPAHFLIGDTMLAPPELDFTETKLNLLDRWQRTQQLVQHFWSKWKNEYLSRLQTRSKWTEKQRCPKVGDICVVKDERSLPYQWPLQIWRI